MGWGRIVVFGHRGRMYQNLRSIAYVSVVVVFRIVPFTLSQLCSNSARGRRRHGTCEEHAQTEHRSFAATRTRSVGSKETHPIFSCTFKSYSMSICTKHIGIIVPAATTYPHARGGNSGPLWYDWYFVRRDRLGLPFLAALSYSSWYKAMF